MTHQIRPDSARLKDYSLLGEQAAKAEAAGLAGATWYQCPVPRKRLKELMQRRDAPAIRSTVLWLGLLLLTGVGGYWYWGTWACVPFFLAYGVLYGTAANARWHEAGHGTAFRTRWLNDVVYHLACFMVMYEPQVWRWSHARHHTDTIIVGRDPEIVEPRPPSFGMMCLKLFALPHVWNIFKALCLHASGRLNDEERTFIPESEWPKVYRTARIWLTLHALVIGSALFLHSWLPLMFVLLPTIYGAWLSYLFGLTQHVGLAEDELDHRTNCRTIYMNPVFRFLYMDMNYHLEHHMFPMVPFHALAELHEAIKADCPPPYNGLLAAYREIIPTLLRQRKDPTYFVKRPVHNSSEPAAADVQAESAFN